MRGIWKHDVGGCGWWNVYIGHRGGLTRRRIDTRCMMCGQRLDFWTHTAKGAGRKRRVLFKVRPDHMPRLAIEKEARNRNIPIIVEEDMPGFQKLGDIVDVKILRDTNGEIYHFMRRKS